MEVHTEKCAKKFFLKHLPFLLCRAKAHSISNSCFAWLCSLSQYKKVNNSFNCCQERYFTICCCVKDRNIPVQSYLQTIIGVWVREIDTQDINIRSRLLCGKWKYQIFPVLHLFLSQHLVINSANIQERDVSVACYGITLYIDHFDALM